LHGSGEGRAIFFPASLRGDVKTSDRVRAGRREPGLAKYGAAASLPLLAHPHMLRHACGFALADQGRDAGLFQDYLGRRNIQHTVRYTATNSARFEKLWR
jgi:site-specific recombinase XerD